MDSMYVERCLVEEKQGWRKEIPKIPYLRFPPHWAVQIIPPFGNACVRFKVQVADNEEEKSVYLDTRGALGYYGKNGDDPYWEVYPYRNDVGRCDIGDTDELFRMIEDTLTKEE